MRMKCTVCGEWWNVSVKEKAKPGKYLCMFCQEEINRAAARQADLREEVEARRKAYAVKRAIRHGGGKMRKGRRGVSPCAKT